MIYSVTPFTGSDEEYERALRLRNYLRPDEPSSIEIWRYWAERRPAATRFQRLMASNDEGQLVAYGEIEQSSPGRDSYSLSLNMLPSAWQSELPEMLYRQLLDHIRPHGQIRLITVARENDGDKLAFLRSKQFKLVLRSPVSTLDVQSFDGDAYASLVDGVRNGGLELSQPPAGWHHDPLWQKRIFDLYWTLLSDTPHYEPRSKPPLARFVEAELRHPNFLADGYFLAVDGQALVGMSNLVMRGGATEVLGTGLTGVIRSHRRRGLATALKVKAIQYAQSLNARRLVTDNEEDNPMYLLNHRLGFSPQPAWTHWEARLG